MSGNAEVHKRLPPDSRRAQILGVAIREFSHHDYDDVSLADVGRAAGVTPGLVNHYFGTKSELYRAVLASAAEQISTLVRTDLGGLPPEERIRRNLNEFFDSLERDREAWQLLFGARTRRDPEVIELVGMIRARTLDRMAQNNAGDADPSPELRLALRIFQGASDAAAAEWLSGRAGREEVLAILEPTLEGLIAAANVAAGTRGRS